MKNILFIIPFLIHSFVSHAQFGPQPPFKVQIESVTATVPGTHSFAFAQSGAKWLIIGGRINGLHGPSNNNGFPDEYANNNIIVIDTTNWQSWKSSLSTLPYSIADPLRSTNMQYYQDGAYLYMIGGFGKDSVLNDFVTYSTLSAIHVDNMIKAVVSSANIAPYIRQMKDTLFRVCGGELMKLGNYYHLMFGHDFEGRYSDPPTPLFTQKYTNQLRKFILNDNGTALSISNVSAQMDTVNFHRRDFNSAPKIKPDGSFAIGAYGGVFKYDKNLPWRNPITIDANGVSVNTAYEQIMSQYTCANFVLYDSIAKNLYTTFLGGISLYDYKPATSTAVLDTLVPFIQDITTFTEHQTGVCEEAVLPVQFSVRLGSNAKFAPAKNVQRFSNGVIKFRGLPNLKRTLIGYMYGGIYSKISNLAASQSWSNDTVYRIYLTPDFNLSTDEVQPEIFSLSAFPNPASESVRVKYKVSSEENVRLSVIDITGKEIEEVFSGKKGRGYHDLVFDAKNLQSGIYVMMLRTSNDYRQIKLCVVRQ
jgi:hypothetical protein